LAADDCDIYEKANAQIANSDTSNRHRLMRVGLRIRGPFANIVLKTVIALAHSLGWKISIPAAS